MPASRNGRVQVQDLRPPEAIQPAPIQSSTFEQPAQAPIDNNLAMLSDALGKFGVAVTRAAHINDAEAKRLEKERQTAVYNSYLADSTPQQRHDDVVNGKVPYWNSPLIGAVVQHNAGDLLAQRVGAQIQDDYGKGKIPLGQEGFNVFEYTKEKFRAGANFLAGSSHAIEAYRKRADAVSLTLSETNEQMKAKALAEFLDNSLANKLRQGFENALKQPGSDIVATMRKIQKEFGPIAQGGGANMDMGRTDEVMLKVLNQFSQNAATAEAALKVLNAERFNEDGKSMGSLASPLKNLEKAEAIRAHAKKALTEDFKDRFQADVLNRNVALLDQGLLAKGLTDQRIENKWSPGDFIHISIDDQKKAAVNEWIRRNDEKLRQTLQQSDVADYNSATAIAVSQDRETKVILNSGYEHPRYTERIQAAFAGAANSTTDSPEKKQELFEAAALYSRLADRNYAWVSQNIKNKDARTYFETFDVMTRYGGLPREQAATALARMNASREATTNPNLEHEQKAKIQTEMGKLDFKPWWFGGSPTNSGELRRQVVELATAVYKSGGGTEEQAVEWAAKAVQARAVYLNGRAVLGEPEFAQGDQKFAQSILDATFEKNKAWLQSQGITKSSELSIQSYRPGSGVFAIVPADPKSLPWPLTNKDGQDLTITAEDIRTQQKVSEKARNDKADREAKEGINPGAAHNLLRGLFGYDAIK